MRHEAIRRQELRRYQQQQSIQISKQRSRVLGLPGKERRAGKLFKQVFPHVPEIDEMRESAY